MAGQEPRNRQADINVQTLYDGKQIYFGRFTCRLSDERWWRENYIGDRFHIVFPRTSVYIRQRGDDEILADPNLAIFYDAGKVYTRRPASTAGDVCSFMMVDEQLLHEAAEAAGMPTPTDRFSFPINFAPSASRTYLRARVISESLRLGSDVDPEELQEGLFLLLSASLDDAAGFLGYRAGVRITDHHRELVEAAREIINRDPTVKLKLTEISRQLAVSSFHLARTFSLHMGMTIHAYRQNLRAREALESVLQGRRLYTVAAETGFSSAGHLTTSFRKVFGLNPSRVASLPTSPDWPARLVAL